MDYLSKKEVDKYLSFISKTFVNSLNPRSNNLLTAVMSTIGWNLNENKDKLFAEVFIEYVPRGIDGVVDERLYTEDGSTYKYPVLKMESYIEENSDHFYSQFLRNFCRQLVWGRNDLNMANIMAGIANFNWLMKDDLKETMLSILVDKGWFGKGKGSKSIKTYWKE